MTECYLCKSNERDEIKYGEFMTRGKVSVHYFCLLLTSNLLQKGRDNQGFLGFLLADIKDEANRVAEAVCCYCKNKSANISCCASKCYRTFHLTCGIANGALNQFMGTFKSYCNRHVRGKKIPRPPQSETCCICYDNFIGEKFCAVKLIRAPCCKNGWFHKWCLAAFAKTSGYFFKCPLCNDNTIFRQCLAQKGIFIPDRDAAWELEPNAFAELLERPNKCSAIVCKAKDGRTATSNNNDLEFCGTCGSVAVHRRCMTHQSSNFRCDECTSIMSAVNSVSIVNISASQQSNNDEEEDVDICEEDEDTSDRNNGHYHDSDSDEGTVQPLGRVKKNVIRIFDNETPSSDGQSDDDGYIIFRRKPNKRNKQISFDDEEESTASTSDQQMKNPSPDRESLFDSGAESDRSACSANIFDSKNTFESSERYLSENAESEPSVSAQDRFKTLGTLQVTTNLSSLEKQQGDPNPVIELKENKTQKEATREHSRYTYLNGIPNENWRKDKRTRSQSLSAEISLYPYTTKEYAHCLPTTFRRSSAALPSEYKTSKPAKSESVSLSLKKPLLELSAKGKMDDFNNSCDTKKISPVRTRTKSEDPSSTTPALDRVRRRSFLRSPYSTASRLELKGDKSSIIQNSSTKKRSRSESLQDCETSSRKRLKNTFASSEIENNRLNTNSIYKRSSSRSISALSSNLCSLHTPSYVKKKEQQNKDKPVRSRVLLPTIHETGVFSVTSKLNIAKSSNKEEDAAAIKTEVIRTTPSSIKYIRSPQETFLNSYSILIDTPSRYKPLKPRNKRIFKDFSNQNLPSNQTKIESFFKRM